MQKEKGMKDVISLNVRSIVGFFQFFSLPYYVIMYLRCNFDSVI